MSLIPIPENPLNSTPCSDQTILHLTPTTAWSVDDIDITGQGVLKENDEFMNWLGIGVLEIVNI